jgi:hypothetical protein
MAVKILTPQEKIGKILRTDKDYVFKLDERLTKVTGRKGVLQKLVEENEDKIKNRLATLGLSRQAKAKDVYDALISKIDADDRKIFMALGKPKSNDPADCARVLKAAQKATGVHKGFFLKMEKAKEFLHNEPPRKVMEQLGYSDVRDLLAKEDLFEVFSALRFVEGNEWLNNKFFRQYETLTPGDFEEREVVARALSAKWNKIAEDFLMKKHHNISHLKEMGVVFVIPATLGIDGELLRMFGLILHYLREIPFYSDMFRKIATLPDLFPTNLTSLLRGDVVDRHITEGEKSLWLVVQRYLAKDDENDWRLFAPHINPEALHWYKAEKDLVTVGEHIDGIGPDLAFWHDVDWVGDYFKDEAGLDVLVSFDLIDTVMALVKKKEMHKYLYHHQESLWNKLFVEYFSGEELEIFSKDYLLQGYFEI